MEIIPLADKKALIPELATRHHAEWQHLNPSLTLEGRNKAIRDAAGREGIPSIYIALSGDELLGSAAIVHHDMDIRRDLSPWLAAVYVKEDYRHQGIASRLISRCELEAVQSGASVWYLYTEYASGLYQKLGWHLMERCLYKGVMVDIMYKRIG